MQYMHLDFHWCILLVYLASFKLLTDMRLAYVKENVDEIYHHETIAQIFKDCKTRC